jgi:hypothetical protein
MNTSAHRRKPDPMLAFIGQVCQSERIKRYADACAKDLPPELRDKFVAYRGLLMVMAGSLCLVLVHARFWTLVAAFVIWVALWPYKSRKEKELDDALGRI